jgi:hypothetical protein
MKHRFAVVVAICACTALVFVLIAQTLAQSNKDTPTPVRYSGRINVLDKDAKTITVQVKNATIQIKYTDKTKFTYRNEPGSVNDLQKGRRVIVLVDPAQKDVVAERIDVTEGK